MTCRFPLGDCSTYTENPHAPCAYSCSKARSCDRERSLLLSSHFVSFFQRQEEELPENYKKVSHSKLQTDWGTGREGTSGALLVSLQSISWSILIRGADFCPEFTQWHLKSQLLISNSKVSLQLERQQVAVNVIHFIKPSDSGLCHVFIWDLGNMG